MNRSPCVCIMHKLYREGIFSNTSLKNPTRNKKSLAYASMRSVILIFIPISDRLPMAPRGGLQLSLINYTAYFRAS